MERTDYKRILSEKIIAMFPDPLMRDLVHGELATYGRETHEREGDRVRVAILKVAGASLEQIREWLTIAKRDYRDVLACAEYPGQLVAPTWRMPPDERLEIELQDVKQYKEWINRK